MTSPGASHNGRDRYNPGPPSRHAMLCDLANEAFDRAYRSQEQQTKTAATALFKLLGVSDASAHGLVRQPASFWEKLRPKDKAPVARALRALAVIEQRFHNKFGSSRPFQLWERAANLTPDNMECLVELRKNLESTYGSLKEAKSRPADLSVEMLRQNAFAIKAFERFRELKFPGSSLKRPTVFSDKHTNDAFGWCTSELAALKLQRDTVIRESSGCGPNNELLNQAEYFIRETLQHQGLPADLRGIRFWVIQQPEAPFLNPPNGAARRVGRVLTMLGSIMELRRDEVAAFLSYALARRFNDTNELGSKIEILHRRNGDLALSIERRFPLTPGSSEIDSAHPSPPTLETPYTEIPLPPNPGDSREIAPVDGSDWLVMLEEQVSKRGYPSKTDPEVFIQVYSRIVQEGILDLEAAGATTKAFTREVGVLDSGDLRAAMALKAYAAETFLSHQDDMAGCLDVIRLNLLLQRINNSPALSPGKQDNTRELERRYKELALKLCAARGIPRLYNRLTELHEAAI